jgi:hypothetical protein
MLLGLIQNACRVYLLFDAIQVIIANVSFLLTAFQVDLSLMGVLIACGNVLHVISTLMEVSLRRFSMQSKNEGAIDLRRRGFLAGDIMVLSSSLTSL